MIRLLPALLLAGILAAGDATLPSVAAEARLWNTHPLDQVTFRAWDGPAKAVEAVRAAGGEVLGVLALVDREEGGREALEAAGLAVVALVTATDLQPLLPA